jgi:hypothetical protein
METRFFWQLSLVKKVQRWVFREGFKKGWL